MMNCEVTVHITEFDNTRAYQIQDELIDGFGELFFNCHADDGAIVATANGFVADAQALPRRINDIIARANGDPCIVGIKLELSKEISELDYRFDRSTGPEGTLVSAVNY